MRKFALLVLALSLPAAGSFAAGRLPSGPHAAWVPGDVLVALAPSASTIAARAGRSWKVVVIR